MTPKEAKVLVIDDDAVFCESLCDGLRMEGYQARAAQTSATGIEQFRKWQPDVVLLDQNLSGGDDGLVVCRELMKLNPEAKVIFATAFGSYRAAVDAIQAGAHDYLSKPLDLDELYLSIRNSVEMSKLEQRERVSSYRLRSQRQCDTIQGNSPAIQEIRQLVSLAAGSRATVLITGETGVGKDVAARGIHKLAGDSDSLITLNCAAIPESLIESELFGHEKGSFTGAITRRKGVFDLAEGGTLVLDEISEMPLQLQSKLLSVLEERRLRRLGGSNEIKIDVRVIATSNRDLDEEIAAGRFRRDLYYRLAVITIHLPPLRERLSDIPQIANSLLQELTGGTITSLPAEQLNSLINYSWPGNARELRNILERAVILAAGGLPDPASLLRTTAPENAALSSAGTAGAIRPLAEVERELIARAMARYQGNRQLAAQALGLSPSTLRRRLIDYDLA